MKTFIRTIANIRFHLLLVVLLSLVISGCRNASHNGDLDGQWQVMEVSYGGEDVQFPEGEIYYYNFYLHTFQLTYTGIRSTRMTGNMTYDEDAGTLGLELGFVKEGRVDKSLMDRLVYWGFPDSGEVVMKIRQLTKSNMVLEYGDVVITCRKF